MKNENDNKRPSISIINIYNTFCNMVRYTSTIPTPIVSPETEDVLYVDIME